MIKRSAIYSVFFCLFLNICSAVYAEGTYARIDLKGSVNPISGAHVVNSIKMAAEAGDSFILFVIDTPGGLVNPMRDIIKAILASEIPVVVFTGPSGAQAASAGAYIMLAGDVNAMASGSEIGAMHPYSPGISFSKEDSNNDQKDVMGMKVLNDMVAYGRSLAQKRGRSIEWVEDAIINASSSSYKEAYEKGIIDIIADDGRDLLQQLDGYTIDFANKSFTFKTKGISERKYNMKSSQKFLNFFADPQLIMLLLIVGIGGIVFEIKQPGLIVPAVIGVTSLILFFMAARILPVSIVGVILIAASVILLVMEIFITSYGLLTLGGVTAFISGSLLLFDNPLQGFSVSWMTIVATGLLILVLVFVVMRAVVAVHKTRVQVGPESLAGQIGTAATDFVPASGGKVYVHGELWSARSDVALSKGDNIEVTEIEGMILTVTKLIREEI
ncbi:MAG: nodulation protein NfeD [Spirochaetes bacterium]|nr:nodulation protein NfeD [Spirochaetota bacterium]MBN2771870.1 nodulation protein NfeD [Spirochaetota bacterium]